MLMGGIAAISQIYLFIELLRRIVLIFQGYWFFLSITSIKSPYRRISLVNCEHRKPACMFHLLRSPFPVAQQRYRLLVKGKLVFSVN